MSWKIISSEIIQENEFLKITKDKCEKSDGTPVEAYYTLNKGPVVVVAAITDNKELVLIKQYRHPVKSENIEVPAGYTEKGESLEESAKRELIEETGYSVKEIKKLHTVFASAGTMDNEITFFLGTGAHKTQDQNLDQNEEIEIQLTPLKEVQELLEKEIIKDMASVLAIHLIQKHL